jgi:hypothetical protein
MCFDFLVGPSNKWNQLAQHGREEVVELGRPWFAALLPVSQRMIRHDYDCYDRRPFPNEVYIYIYIYFIGPTDEDMDERGKAPQSQPSMQKSITKTNRKSKAI